MTYFATTQIIPADSPATDAFHRLRVSNVIKQFSTMAEYADHPLIWEQAVVGTGAVALQANICTVRLTTGGTVNLAAATRQTRRYMRYSPGKSLLTLNTFTMSAAQTNAVAEIGYYDANNGIFFQRSGTTFNVVRRTYTSGSVVDNAVAQSSWNLDKLDGTGASGVTLDVTKVQILVIDLQFLGVGKVRIGFDLGAAGIVYCHQFLHANILTLPYMSSACLPVRGTVYNIGTAGGIVTLDMICSAVASEADTASNFEEMEGNYKYSQNSNNTLLTTNSAAIVPLFSLRAATKLGGSSGGTTTNRGQIIPTSITLFTTQDIFYEVWQNATLTGASWTANNASSIADYDFTATGITTTSAYKLASGYLPITLKTMKIDNFTNIPLSYTGLNSTQDTITVVARNITTGGTAAASIDWVERY